MLSCVVVFSLACVLVSCLFFCSFAC